eukprot:TRINITY_DN14816_c0_g1_i1.p1 TRINITY_DN14816_c0_g1~~TRINITY_DN14816_c0_g1_i1.p1  ORF type:complete len:829 (+),score=85.84 TRINITY_DN14816_c0_g1_i1:438-2924(+)
MSPGLLLQDSCVKLWDLRDPSENSKSAATFGEQDGAQQNPVRDVKFSPFEGTVFACACDNGTVRLWDLRQPARPLRTIIAHGDDTVLSLDWHPTERGVLASASRDKTVKVWTDVHTAEAEPGSSHSLANSFAGSPNASFALSHSASSSAVAASGMTGARWTVQCVSPLCRVLWRPHCSGDSDSHLVASSNTTTDLELHVWDVLRPHIPVKSFKGHKDIITDFVWWRGEPHSLLTVSRDGTLRVSAIRDGGTRNLAQVPATSVTWSAQGNLAASADTVEEREPTARSPLSPTSAPVTHNHHQSVHPLAHPLSSPSLHSHSYNQAHGHREKDQVYTLQQYLRPDSGGPQFPSVRCHVAEFGDHPADQQTRFEKLARRYAAVLRRFGELSVTERCLAVADAAAATDQPALAATWRVLALLYRPLPQSTSASQAEGGEPSSAPASPLLTQPPSAGINPATGPASTTEEEDGQLSEPSSSLGSQSLHQVLTLVSASVPPDPVVPPHRSPSHQTRDLRDSPLPHSLSEGEAFTDSAAEQHHPASTSEDGYASSPTPPPVHRTPSPATAPLASSSGLAVNVPPRTPSPDASPNTKAQEPESTSLRLVIDLTELTGSTTNYPVPTPTPTHRGGNDAAEIVSMHDTVRQLFDFYAEGGDVQTCAMLALALGEDAVHCLGSDPLAGSGSSRIQEWLFGYLELLQQHQLFKEAAQVVKRTGQTGGLAPAVAKSSRGNTIIHCLCGACGKVLRPGHSRCDTCHSKTHTHQHPHGHVHGGASGGMSAALGRPTFQCCVCREAVKGLYVWISVCGHGGHVDHLQDWFSTHRLCPQCGAEAVL